MYPIVLTTFSSSLITCTSRACIWTDLMCAYVNPLFDYVPQFTDDPTMIFFNNNGGNVFLLKFK